MHYLITQEDVVNHSNIASGDVAVAVLVAVDEIGVVVVKQPVINSCHIGTSHEAIAVHIAGLRRSYCIGMQVNSACHLG